MVRILVTHSSGRLACYLSTGGGSDEWGEVASHEIADSTIFGCFTVPGGGNSLGDPTLAYLR